MKFRILSAILRSSWAIDERFAISHGGIVAGLFNGLELASSDEDTTEQLNALPFALGPNSDRKYSAYDDAPKGSIAIIPILGPLMKSDQEDCGEFSAGMETLGSRVMEADLHPNISSLILYIDSPGGTVDGTQALMETIRGTQKKVVAFVDGCMASAALWIGSAADYIIAQNSTTEIGSIGVMVQFADMQKRWEAQGIVIHRISADQSSDKNKEYYDALQGDYEAIKKERLNPLADIFISSVKQNRPQANDSVFTGKVYFAEEALSLGLIDEIGSLAVAVQKAASLWESTSASSLSINTHTSMNKFEKLSAVIGAVDIEVTDEGAFLNADQLALVETALAQEPVAAVLESNDEEVTALNDRIVALESDLAEARRLPAADSATAVVDSDGAGNDEDINAILEPMSMGERIEYLKNKS